MMRAIQLLVLLALICPISYANDSLQSWRKASVVPATDRYGHPSLNDLDIGPNGEIYVVRGYALSQLVDGRIVPVGGVKPRAAAILTAPHRGKYLLYSKPQVRVNPNLKQADVRMVEQLPGDSLQGVIRHFAVAADGTFWVVDQVGRVYRKTASQWKVQDVMANNVATGTQGAVAVWSFRPEFEDHQRWLKNNPAPLLWQDKRWVPQPGLLGLESIAFDAQDNAIALVFNAEENIRRLLIHKGNGWHELPNLPDVRNVQSDLTGRIVALTYSSEKIEGKGWVNSRERLHTWQDDHWVTDNSIPDLHTSLHFGAGSYGRLITYQGKLTWVSKQKWLSLTNVPASQVAKPAATVHAPVTAAAALNLQDSIWYSTIRITNPEVAIDPALSALWEDGAYLHMREDGALGFNWDKREDFAYLPENSWLEDEQTLVVRLGMFHYVFDEPFNNDQVETTLGNSFHMVMKKVE